MQKSRRKQRILWGLQPLYLGGAEVMAKSFIEGMDRKRFEHYVFLPAKSKCAKYLKDSSVHIVYEYRNLRKVLKKFKIDLVYLHAFRLLRLGLEAKRAKIPVIYHAHSSFDFTGFGLSKRKMRGLLKWIYLIADKIIVVSSQMKKDYRFISKKGDVCIVNNAVSLNTLRGQSAGVKLRKQYSIPDNVPLIVLIARVEPRKNTLLFLKSAKILKRKYPGVTFVVMGDVPASPYAKAAFSYAKKQLPAKSVMFSGFINNVRQVVQEADVLVLPSTAEGMPVSLLEGMAAGKPVIAVKKWGKEFIAHKKNGFLLDSPNVKELCAAVSYLLDKEWRRKKMGAMAKRTVKEKFSIKIAVKKIERIISEVLKAEGGIR